MTAHGMSRRKLSTVGNYKLTGKTLGKGNFARVEEASHELLGIKVAVKIMDLNVIKEDYVVRNLLREAQIMSGLKHPCIISLFETMQKSDKLYYLVTEVVTGGDLCTYVKAQLHGRLEEKIAKYFAQQFVSAISYMHKKGIVHRDLKMENVMLNGAQTLIKIVDFGLSNQWTPESPLKTHCGSPEYAAPELFVTGKVYGPEVDLWSLGIILYGMVVGQLPFVCTKKPTMSSQERRQLLVAQINKGISTTQRKAIAPFSLEFKNLLSRLLNADSKKRINIKEAIVHPWITENGKKLVRTSPLKKITLATHNKMIKDITNICGPQKEGITEVIEKNPFGTMAGMYNILFHRSMIKPFTPNLLMKTALENTAFVHQKSSDRQRTESPMKLLQSIRLQEDKEKKMIYPQPTSNNNLGKTRTILTKKDISQLPKISTSGKNAASEKNNPRPRSVQFPKNYEMGNGTEARRPATSAFHKRQEYSASLAMRGLVQNVTRSVKGRRSVNDEGIERKKCSSRKCERCDEKIITDGSMTRKTPRTPASTTRKSSTDRYKNIKTISATEPQQNECSTNLSNFSHIYKLMKLITPEKDQGKKAGGERCTKSTSKTGSNKSSVSNNSGIPIMTRPTSRRSKMRSKPSSTNIQNNVSNTRRLR